MECSSPWLRISQRMICVVALIASLSQVIVNANNEFQIFANNVSNPEELKVKWSDFPSNFVFGVGTAAAQIEGSATEDGRGPSVWDHFTKKFPDQRPDYASNFSLGVDSYKRYKDDVKLVKALGVDSYRFSISWTRILPNGTLSGGVNQKGIDYYNSLIDEVIRNGLTPFVTLLHFDAPQALTDKYGGMLNRSFVGDFKDYTELCFKTYGDRVKNWITINEPVVVSKVGYGTSSAPPGRCSEDCTDGNSGTEPYIVTHNIILAHATVVKLYREKFQAKQGGQIGWCHVARYIEPSSPSRQDKAAAKRLMDFDFGWLIEPTINGKYPISMRRSVKERLPRFTKKERKMVKGSFDFIGINYYTSRYGKSVPPFADLLPRSYFLDRLAVDLIKNASGVQIGPQAPESDYVYSYPKGLEKMLLFIKRIYKNPKIYITENGFPERRNNSKGLMESLKDPHRIECILRHLYMIKKAMEKGVNVQGYFHWTLLDDFEWQEGFNQRFGFYYVDYHNNFRRIAKESAKWLPRFLKG